MGARNKATGPVHDWFLELGGPQGEHYARQLTNLALAPHGDPHVRLKALAIIAGYVWGKPPERVEVTGSGGGPLRVIHEYHPA